MTITRTIWRRAHAVRLPKADAYEAVHAELFAAFEQERRIEAAAALMVWEIELALQREFA